MSINKDGLVSIIIIYMYIYIYIYKEDELPTPLMKRTFSIESPKIE